MMKLIVLLAAMLVGISGQFPLLGNYNRCNYCNTYGLGYGGYRGGYGGYNYGLGYTPYSAGIYSPQSSYLTSSIYANPYTLSSNTLCRDRSPNCAYMVSMGECATNPVATRAMCPISCGTGCNYLGSGVGTMDALADAGFTNSMYTNSLMYPGLSPSGIYKERSAPKDKTTAVRPTAEKTT